MLHELTLWLAASVLNVRAERALQFPEQQDIGELRLSFIRLSPSTHSMKRFVIMLGPLVAGFAALWAIAIRIFQWEVTLGLASAGTIDELGRMIASITRTADFWLWFYLAFTIANTMFPSIPGFLRKRQKAMLVVALPFFGLIVWRIAGAANPALAHEIEGLVSSLALVIMQIITINVAAVLVLGSVEAVIERLTNMSATFRDGKMITMTRQEARQLKLRPRPQRRSARAEQVPPLTAPAPNSIYDIKLPIPGPPGREPVSRNAVMVVNMDNLDSAATPEGVIPDPPNRVPLQVSSLAKTTPEKNADLPPALGRGRVGGTEQSDNVVATEPFRQSDHQRESHGIGGDIPGDPPAEEASAPFIRPFVHQDTDDASRGHWDEQSAEAKDEPFARPFVMATRSDKNVLDQDRDNRTTNQDGDHPKSTNTKHLASTSAADNEKGATISSRTRPAPKPSKQDRGKGEDSVSEVSGELEYEDLEDGDSFADDDELYDDML